MRANNAQRLDADSAGTATSTALSPYPNFRRYFDADPERPWEVEVVRNLIKLANMQSGWDSYGAPPIRRDTGLFALEILSRVMRKRTPLPQVVPSSVGGI